jgi:hypothetical protein
MDRHRCQSLVGAETPVWASTALEPEDVEHPGSGVQPDPGGPGVCAMRSAALGESGLLSRGERLRSACIAACGKRIASIRYGNRHEVPSSNRLFIVKRMPGRTFFSHGPARRSLLFTSPRRLPLEGGHQRRILSSAVSERLSALYGVPRGRSNLHTRLPKLRTISGLVVFHAGHASCGCKSAVARIE